MATFTKYVYRYDALFDFSQAFDVPCDRCGWLGGLDGVQAVGDQQVSKMLYHQCVADLVRAGRPERGNG